MKGIENLKFAILWAISVANQTAEALEDGKFRLFEIFGFVDEAKGLADLAPKIPEAVEEFKDLTTEEKNELVVYVGRMLNIGKEEAEYAVKVTIDQLITTYISIQAWRAIAKGERPNLPETESKPVA